MVRLVARSLLALAAMTALAACGDSVAAPTATPSAPAVTLRGTCTTTTTPYYSRYDVGSARSATSDVELAVRLNDGETAISTLVSSTSSLPDHLWTSAQVSREGDTLRLTMIRTDEIGRDTVYDTSFSRESYECSLSSPATSSVARLGS
jgi:hypothetical protein